MAEHRSTALVKPRCYRLSRKEVSSMLALLLLLAVDIFTPLQASDQGHGRVSMEGSIIDTPCAIDVASQDQTIEMATVPVSDIVRNGSGPAQPFSIQLVNCTLASAAAKQSEFSHFLVTFDGSTERDNLFGVNGEARGVGLQIADATGSVAIPGQPMSAGELQPGDMNLNYTLRLMGNHQALVAGSYRTTVRFKLDYY